MNNIIINGEPVIARGGETILEAARKVGVHIPTLCYLKDLNCIGSCRVCLVDVEGEGLAASCNTAVREGMRVRTDTPQVAAAQAEAIARLREQVERTGSSLRLPRSA